MNTEYAEKKFEVWKHGLLDLSRRNRLMHFRRTLGSTLQILVPEMEEMYRRLAAGEKLTFRHLLPLPEDDPLSSFLYLMEKAESPVELADGEVRGEQTLPEMARTLVSLRQKARLSLEEQGINILYLAVGFLRWRPSPQEKEMVSPLVLVPVTLEQAGLSGCMSIRRLEEDIVVNPTLEYALSEQCGFSLPELDAGTEDIGPYLRQVEEAVSSRGFAVVREAHLGLFSFLKIMMYRDLSGDRKRIFSHPVIRAFCGDPAGLKLPEAEMAAFDHDSQDPESICQVVTADASQQDAIRLSREGVSFVLQGPPGTGKSQTITNIIAQALADGRKVLFVSEKMAALNVVYRRLQEVGLAEACLSLHNVRADRRAVLEELVSTLDAPLRTMKPGATELLSVLREEREALNAYVREIHRTRMPLGISLYDAMAALEEGKPDCFYYGIQDSEAVSREALRKRETALDRLAEYRIHYGNSLQDNPWQDSSPSLSIPEVQRVLGQEIPALLASLQEAESRLEPVCPGRVTLKMEEMRRRFCAIQAFADLCTRSGFSFLAMDQRENLQKLQFRGNSLREKMKGCGADPKAEARESAEQDALLEAETLLSTLEKAVPVRFARNRDGLQQAVSLVKALAVAHPVVPAWLEKNRYTALMLAVSDWEKEQGPLLAMEEQINRSWKPGIYEVLAEAMLFRFEHRHTGFRKLFSGEYHQDRAQLTALAKSAGVLSDEECRTVLRQVTDYHHACEALENRMQENHSLLGAYDGGIHTDFPALREVLRACAPAAYYASHYPMSDAVRQCLEMSPAERSAVLAEKTGESPAFLLARLERLQGMMEDTGEDWNSRSRTLEVRLSCCREYAAFLSEAAPFLPAGTEMTPENAEAMLASFAAVEEQRRPLLEELTAIPDGGMPADSREGREALQRAQERIRKVQHLKELPGVLDAFLADSRDNPAEQAALRTLAAWFPDTDFLGMPSGELARKLQGMQDPETFRHYRQYAVLRGECEALGVLPFVQFAESRKIPEEKWKDVYHWSFLTQFVMDTLTGEALSGLLHFASYAQEKRIASFREHDAAERQIARARLLHALSHARPSALQMLVQASAEAGILRKEAEKKRRMMPLRKLFRTIPGLLQQLKPCFMMSPLSVSYFLDAGRYDFDLVIFDEASQILPEDAVGAIYRGRQVIIAGDTRQLPPTSFFTAAAAGDENGEEDEEEYLPDVVSESVLDEAAACLPSCTLLWHYRSRDESLIAFSNEMLYHHRLMTFPSPARLPDRGLQYVYVPDGIYEGNGRNCNRKEAEKCLALVLEHIRDHPERSLGIIAFSEKQQRVIEETVEAYRLQHPGLEDFFREDREEPFFVKNLENVQGDERDTILFSIGYARNQDGRMYQRFGPLSQEGGERRLNVAITRAKYNVKLVGSILPGDIVVREGTGAGVRMLREYIHYAMQQDAGTAVAGGETEPFVEVVAGFLEKEGYTCVRQVGASDYKVDLGILAGTDPGTFLAGIECDGGSYLRARTARERDILRREIMGGLGWNLHHVWSMGWYSHPREEKEKLLEFLKECRKNGLPENTAPPAQPEPTETLLESSTREEMMEALTFEVYQEAETAGMERRPGEDRTQFMRRCMLEVIRREQPVHHAVLEQRLQAVCVRDRVLKEVMEGLEKEDPFAPGIRNRQRFFYTEGAPVRPRRPEKGKSARAIHQIWPQELRAALCQVLQVLPELTRGDLARETARQLGYTRAGNRILETLRMHTQQLVLEGVLEEQDGKLKLKEGMQP